MELSNLKQRSPKTPFDSWNSGLSNSFPRSNRDDNTLIPGFHAEALQQTKQYKGSPSNCQHVDSVWALVVAHASSRSGISLAHSAVFDSSELVLAEKFFANARLWSWIVVRNGTAESDLRVPSGRR